jgi:hypothetical protein
VSYILPPFTSEGLLPIGDHLLTLDQLRKSHLVTGEGSNSPSWDATWRLHLVNNLAVLAEQLWAVGISDIFVDGSFVENKGHPSDIDGYFVIDVARLNGRLLEYELNKLDPYKVWTWSHHARIAPATGDKPQLPMWLYYHVELFPHFPGLLSGIPDEFGNPLSFPAAFRQSRLHHPKGIIALQQEKKS